LLREGGEDIKLFIKPHPLNPPLLEKERGTEIEEGR
jgi:hypothetical protein